MNTPTMTTTVPAVRFGTTHGYRFAADEVELNATFIVADHRSAHDRSWALQLWACPSVPARSDDLVGHLVAEAPLPPIAEIAGEFEPFTVSAAAQPPAGDRDHSMVLVLAARRGGRFDEVHDVTSFPARERFVLPRLAGPVSYTITGDRVLLEVAGIENPRALDNLSGTLSFELWALPNPYSGGQFEGSPLAGAVLGSLAGQSRWSELSLDLNYTAPQTGRRHVVGMLREWTGSGYTTRDFANLEMLPAGGDVIVSPVAQAPVPSTAEAPALAKVELPIEDRSLANPAGKNAPSSASKQPAPAPITPSAMAAKDPARKTAAAITPVSVNHATLDQLLGVKGMPRAVAERIVSERPFNSLEQLKKVKGMGEKLLAKLRGALKL